jgi:hypothetical protein
MTPVPPSEIKATIPSASGSFCEKFLRVLNLPKLFSEWYAWVHNEDGSWTDDFIADLCAIKCACSGADTLPPDPGVPGGPVAPTNVQATDGAFSNKVVVTWGSVTAATSYEILRSVTSDFSTAAVIGTTTGNLSTTYEDATVSEGQVYYYWVRGYNGALRGAASTSDTGYSVGAISAVSDLKASRGFYSAHMTGAATGTGRIALVFTAGTGANAYDIFRGKTDDFTAATKIDSNRVPFDTARKSTLCSPTPCTKPMFIDNGGHLLYYDYPPGMVQRYYYWVVAKHVSETIVQAVSEESNSAYGWAVFDSTVATQIVSYDFVSPSSPAPIIGRRAFVVLVGPVAGGGGGNGSYGGGGGGGGAIITGYFDLVAGANRRWLVVTDTAAGGAAEADGEDSIVAELQYDPGTGNFATILSTSAAGGGKFNGAGGVGSTGTVVGAVTDTDTEPGFAGEAADGLLGGRGGCAFGFFRSNPVNFPNTWHATGQPSHSLLGGGGSDALPLMPASAKGGIGNRGYAIIVYY